MWPEKNRHDRARALKNIIRARAAKTGEGHTAARLHVLNDRPPVPHRPSQTAPASACAKDPQVPARSRGGLSDAKALEKTGHGLDHWFAVLDWFGGVEKGHTASARHLRDAHKVDGWYAQGITVAFERSRGVPAVNQRCDGEYDVSVSKVMSAGVADVIRALPLQVGRHHRAAPSAPEARRQGFARRHEQRARGSRDGGGSAHAVASRPGGTGRAVPSR